MKHQKSVELGSLLTGRVNPRVAVVGAGIAGLTCARELQLRGYDPVVFEAGDRLGGRCSSLATRIGSFDDAAQCIGGATRLASYAVQRPGELAAMHAWTVPATAAEDEPKGRDRDADLDEAEVTRTLKLMGAVGVPSMRALADAIARPLEVRLQTPIQRVRRQGSTWILSGIGGEIEEDFQALVLAIPAPLALPLAQASPQLTAALRAVRYRSRWVLLLGSERPVGLPGFRAFQGSPIERVAAMHSKPGRPANGPQRWFIEADELWSQQHEQDDASTVADLLLDIFRAHAGRLVTPNFVCAQQWRHAFVDNPATLPGLTDCLWDSDAQLGVCGDSVVTSQVDRVHASGVALARAMADTWTARRAPAAAQEQRSQRSEQFEAQT